MRCRILAASAFALLLGGGLFAAAGCGGGAAMSDGVPTPTPEPPTPTPGPTATPTPEGDDDVFRIAPVAASSVVYVANPDNDDVARVDTLTRSVSVIPVGNDPVDLSVAPNGSRVATFNALSHDVSVVDTATGDETRLAVRHVTNAMIASPLASHGVCVYAPSRDPGGAIAGSENPGEVSVVDFAAKTVVSAVMGSTPRAVAFTPDDANAYVLSDGLLAHIDLTSPAKTRTFIPLSLDPSTAPVSREIAVAPDGTSAFVLTADTSAGLLRVDPIGNTFTPVAVGAPGEIPTDLDQTFDGRFFVVASVGTSSTIDLFDRDNAFTRTSVTLPGPAGSVEPAPDADVLYAFSRSALDERLWQIDLNPAPGGPTPVVTEFALVKPVRSVFVARNGGGVIVLHRFEDVVDGAPANENSFADDDVMTVIDPDTGGGVPLLSPVALSGPPDAVAVTSDGAWAFAQIPTKDLLLVIDLGSLLVDPLPVSSEPVFVGAVPGAHTGYSLQKHPLGRLSFVTPETMEIQTVTGFEINGEIQ